ncbi:MAG: hypothetical protein GY909_15390 [Oligoflexia bacterium]|nr:hypothetical protein [Oligoflexia bacterium]
MLKDKDGFKILCGYTEYVALGLHGAEKEEDVAYDKVFKKQRELEKETGEKYSATVYQPYPIRYIGDESFSRMYANSSNKEEFSKLIQEALDSGVLPEGEGYLDTWGKLSQSQIDNYQWLKKLREESKGSGKVLNDAFLEMDVPERVLETFSNDIDKMGFIDGVYNPVGGMEKLADVEFTLDREEAHSNAVEMFAKIFRTEFSRHSRHFWDMGIDLFCFCPFSKDAGEYARFIIYTVRNDYEDMYFQVDISGYDYDNGNHNLKIGIQPILISYEESEDRLTITPFGYYYDQFEPLATSILGSNRTPFRMIEVMELFFTVHEPFSKYFKKETRECSSVATHDFEVNTEIQDYVYLKNVEYKISQDLNESKVRKELKKIIDKYSPLYSERMRRVREDVAVNDIFSYSQKSA